MPSPSDDEPLDLDRVDQEIRINNLRNQIEDLTGEEFVMNKASDLPPDLEEEFLAHMLVIEECAEEPAFGVLEGEGVSMPAPDELDDAALHEVLWKVIHACARGRGVVPGLRGIPGSIRFCGGLVRLGQDHGLGCAVGNEAP